MPENFVCIPSLESSEGICVGSSSPCDLFTQSGCIEDQRCTWIAGPTDDIAAVCSNAPVATLAEGNCPDSPCIAGEVCIEGSCAPLCIPGESACTPSICVPGAGDLPPGLGACVPGCGDSICKDGEDCNSCPADCGECPCGDGSCDLNEDCSLCPEDCGVCDVCGNGQCGPEETCSSCSEDCGACPIVCGDQVCDLFETCSDCPADCGECPGVCDTVNTPECGSPCDPLCSPRAAESIPHAFQRISTGTSSLTFISQEMEDAFTPASPTETAIPETVFYSTVWRPVVPVQSRAPETTNAPVPAVAFPTVVPHRWDIAC